jgi:hypothetical protein
MIALASKRDIQKYINTWNIGRQLKVHGTLLIILNQNSMRRVPRVDFAKEVDLQKTRSSFQS